MPLLDPYNYGAMLVIAVICEHHSWQNCGCLPLSDAFMVPSCPLKADPQERGFQFLISAAQRPLEPVSEVHGVLRNRDLRSSSGRTSKTMATVCNSWGVLWKILTSNSRVSLMLGAGVSVR